MKNPSILAMLAILLAMAALASSLSTRFRAGPEPQRPALRSAQSYDALELRVGELEHENRSLRDRLAALELAPVASQRTSATPAPPSQAAVTREDFEAFRDEVRKALQGRGTLAGQLARDPDEFKLQVASTLGELRKEEAAGSLRRKQELRIERLDQTMPKLESWLELTPSQSTEMRAALLARYNQEADILHQWENGADPEALGELKQRDREVHLQELSRFLSPAQLETYTAREGSGK